MQISKKGKPLNYQTSLILGGHGTALTDKCWAATCGCKIKAPTSEKRRRKSNSRKTNASESNLKITKREKNKMFTPCIANNKKDKSVQKN